MDPLQSTASVPWSSTTKGLGDETACNFTGLFSLCCKRVFQWWKRMPEERLLVVVFHSSSFVVVSLVTRSTMNLALYSVKITSITEGLAMSKRVLVFEQRLLKWPVGYTPIKIMYRSSRIWIIPTHQKVNNLAYIRKTYELIDWHLDMPSVASAACQKSHYMRITYNWTSGADERNVSHWVDSTTWSCPAFSLVYPMYSLKQKDLIRYLTEALNIFLAVFVNQFPIN